MNAPWYHSPWPWLLMAGPAAVLVAGAATTWIAFASADGLVAEDYYKQGLGINRRLAREDAAQKLGIDASLRLHESRIEVILKGATPEALFVQLVHPTRAGHDVRVRLLPSADGAYQAELPPLPPGRWRAAIEDARGTWRIVKEAL
jgi:uncharacterized protein